MIASACLTDVYESQPPAGEPRAEATISLELRAGLSPQETDRRIAQASRAGDVGARVLAFYLADMADRGAHQALGFSSITLYAERRYHIQPSTTREYVAAGRALQALPAIDEAFCRGRLLWSQARELARVATPETETEWVEFAVGRTAREIAAAVRMRAKGERPTDPARRRLVSCSTSMSRGQRGPGILPGPRSATRYRRAGRSVTSRCSMWRRDCSWRRGPMAASPGARRSTTRTTGSW